MSATYEIKPVTDNYNGVKITDHYRWLEDLKNPEVTDWFKKQADFSKNFIEKEMEDLRYLINTLFFKSVTEITIEKYK